MLISVVLCTYNPNESYLARTLDGVFSQELNLDEWEFIVIDNNSSVPVSERACVRQRGVRVEFEREQGLSAARGCGLRHARGEILVFIDDDNVMAPDYLSNVKTIFAAPNIGVVSGAIMPEYEREPEGWFSDFESMLAIRKPRGERAYLTSIPLYNECFPVGAGMAVRRKVIGDYYREIADGGACISGRVGTQLSSAEDLDLDFFAISQGYLVGTVGTLKMIHIIPATRTTSDYITRLALASEKSVGEVNDKWRGLFGSDVFDLFAASRFGLVFRLIVSRFLFWKPRFRILYRIFWARLERTWH